ncbi:hypothetical protein CTT30_19345 [Vibrio coralliilyticus]|nr:hypothetical protein CTT30_19345 [Vibrio coralliilyticus]
MRRNRIKLTHLFELFEQENLGRGEIINVRNFGKIGLATAKVKVLDVLPDLLLFSLFPMSDALQYRSILAFS